MVSSRAVWRATQQRVAIRSPGGLARRPDVVRSWRQGVSVMPRTLQPKVIGSAEYLVTLLFDGEEQHLRGQSAQAGVGIVPRSPRLSIAVVISYRLPRSAPNRPTPPTWRARLHEHHRPPAHCRCQGLGGDGLTFDGVSWNSPTAGNPNHHCLRSRRAPSRSYSAPTTSDLHKGSPEETELQLIAEW